MVVKGRFFFVVLVLFFFVSFAEAVESDTICASASTADISPSSVRVGEDFTVGISVESCGEVVPNFVRFELLDVSKDISVKEPFSIDVGRLEYSNSKRFITYHMRALDSSSPGAYIIKTRLVYGSGNLSFVKDGNITFTVTSDEAKITLASVKTTPTFPVKGESFTLSVRLENYGRGNADSVKAEVSLPESFAGAKKSFLGQLAAGDDGIMTFSLIPQKEGDFPYNLIVTFKDDFGTHEYSENLDLFVQKKQNGIVIFVVVVILAVVVSIYFLYRNSKKKRERKMIEKISKRGG